MINFSHCLTRCSYNCIDMPANGQLWGKMEKDLVCLSKIFRKFFPRLFFFPLSPPFMLRLFLEDSEYSNKNDWNLETWLENQMLQAFWHKCKCIKQKKTDLLSGNFTFCLVIFDVNADFITSESPFFPFPAGSEESLLCWVKGIPRRLVAFSQSKHFPQAGLCQPLND